MPSVLISCQPCPHPTTRHGPLAPSKGLCSLAFFPRSNRSRQGVWLEQPPACLRWTEAATQGELRATGSQTGGVPGTPSPAGTTAPVSPPSLQGDANAVGGLSEGCRDPLMLLDQSSLLHTPSSYFTVWPLQLESSGGIQNYPAVGDSTMREPAYDLPPSPTFALVKPACLMTFCPVLRVEPCLTFLSLPLGPTSHLSPAV